MLEHHQLKGIVGEHVYNYTFGSKIKKLALDETTYNALVNGRLALCGLNEVTYLVTSETAEKVAALDASIILVKNDQLEADVVEEDDPYADYQIPDDLMW